MWLLPLDLASLASVRSCAAAFLKRDEPLHVLVNNAGVGGQRGLTEDGFELHFGVNHLGHFALTSLLLERLKASGPGARIVNVSSEAHYDAPGVDFDALRRRTRSITGLREYSVSKLCNVLFTQELSRRVPSVSAYALHPGVVASDIWRRVPWPARTMITRRMLTVDQGALTSVHCATSPAVAGESGLFYDKCQVREPSSLATPELGRAAVEAQRRMDRAQLGSAAVQPGFLPHRLEQLDRVARRVLDHHLPGAHPGDDLVAEPDPGGAQFLTAAARSGTWSMNRFQPPGRCAGAVRHRP